MTDDLAQRAARHGWSLTAGGNRYCTTCHQDWPCDVNALLMACVAAEQRAQAAEAAVLKYGRHLSDCDAWRTWERECDCGLYPLKAVLASEEGQHD